MAFVAMMAVFGATFTLVIHALDSFNIGGLHRLFVPFAADALCGVLGYFAFTGDGRLRTMLVFVSAIAFGGVAVTFFDPGKTWYPLLTSVPFAAVAALTARAMGLYMEKREADKGRQNSP